jgi:hypothetical protein
MYAYINNVNLSKLIENCGFPYFEEVTKSFREQYNMDISTKGWSCLDSDKSLRSSCGCNMDGVDCKYFYERRIWRNIMNEFNKYYIDVNNWLITNYYNEYNIANLSEEIQALDVIIVIPMYEEVISKILKLINSYKFCIQLRKEIMQSPERAKQVEEQINIIKEENNRRIRELEEARLVEKRRLEEEERKRKEAEQQWIDACNKEDEKNKLRRNLIGKYASDNSANVIYSNNYIFSTTPIFKTVN